MVGRRVIVAHGGSQNKMPRATQGWGGRGPGEQQPDGKVPPTLLPIISKALLLTTTIVTCGYLTIGNALSVTNEQLLFLEAWRAVDRAYVDKTFNGQSWFKVREDWLKKEKMGDRQQTYDAIKRLLQLLDDPFTRFLTPEQYSALRSSTSGSVTGVGVEVSFQQVSKPTGKGPALVVISPAPGGPAERAGIRAGDEITSIDGQDVSDMSLYAVGNLLQGAEGTTVVLGIRNHSVTLATSTIRSVVLVRQPITFNPVDGGVCMLRTKESPSKTISYLRVASFSKQTSEKFMSALKQMSSSNVSSAAIVLDFRNNGGGLFPAAVEIARMLIDRGDIVLIADSQGVRDVYEANGNALDTTTPIIMLVNKGTASASEVLAGALKDDNRATIVGEDTFGKGLIQTVVPLSDGSALAVTVAKYQTPSGKDINKVGIEPNVKLDGDSIDKIPMQPDKFCDWINGDGDPAVLQLRNLF